MCICGILPREHDLEAVNEVRAPISDRLLALVMTQSEETAHRRYAVLNACGASGAGPSVGAPGDPDLATCETGRLAGVHGAVSNRSEALLSREAVAQSLAKVTVTVMVG